MKILISVALWGRHYAKIFADYSLPSMLTEGNLPRLSQRHDVVYHIMTTRKDGGWLREQPALRRLERHVPVDWDFIEDRGYSLRPTGRDKYPFLSVLQNLAISKSLDHNALVFNYADFVWADGSLTHAVAMLTDGVDAVLSFCLPVDTQSGMRELDRFFKGPPAAAAGGLPPRSSADIAIRCLHREARLRYWDGPDFTHTPTYLLWPVGEEGLVIRAYHQTILVLRVKADTPAYKDGIPGGSLDGYFTSLLAHNAAIRHATNSDEVMVFSLYDSTDDSRIGRRSPNGEARDVSLRNCLREMISDGQRKFAAVPIEVRRAFSHPDEWRHVEQVSGEILDGFHRTTAFDRREYERVHTHDVSLRETAERWRRASTLQGRLRSYAIACYDWLDSRASSRKLIRLLKAVLGPARASDLRAAFERLVYRLKSGRR